MNNSNIDRILNEKRIFDPNGQYEAFYNRILDLYRDYSPIGELSENTKDDLLAELEDIIGISESHWLEESK